MGKLMKGMIIGLIAIVAIFLIVTGIMLVSQLLEKKVVFRTNVANSNYKRVSDIWIAVDTDDDGQLEGYKFELYSLPRSVVTEEADLLSATTMEGFKLYIHRESPYGVLIDIIGETNLPYYELSTLDIPLSSQPVEFYSSNNLEVLG